MELEKGSIIFLIPQINFDRPKCMMVIEYKIRGDFRIQRGPSRFFAKSLGGLYFFKNLLKRFPGLAGVAPGWAVGRAVGFTLRAGSGRGDFTALAGTAKGLRVLELLGCPGAEGCLGVFPRVAAIPIFGATVGLNFSACRVAVAGTGIGGALAAMLLSKARAIFSTVLLSWSTFWRRF